MSTVTESRTVHLQPGGAAMERRLSALLARNGLSDSDPGLVGVVQDAQLLGSLDLAGFRFTWEEVRAARASGAGPEPILSLQRAQVAVDPKDPLSVAAARAWHIAIAGPVGYRRTPRARDVAPPAPPEAIESRLLMLEEWLGSESVSRLEPAPVAALALARLVEILPFDDANGRVSRLAASHLMVRGKMRPPILVSGDRARLEACLQAAFRFQTEPLVALLVEASGRALEVMIQTLERTPA
jgi:hypothetical protein